jgi:hypothetical protein
MKKSVAKKWVKALRSGKYEQISGKLERKGGFCCLGVLCKVAEENGKRVNKTAEGKLWGGSLSHHPAVLDWAGLKTSMAILNDSETDDTSAADSLVNQNDLRGANFNTIADIIEDWYTEI